MRLRTPAAHNRTLIYRNGTGSAQPETREIVLGISYYAFSNPAIHMVALSALFPVLRSVLCHSCGFVSSHDAIPTIQTGNAVSDGPSLLRPGVLWFRGVC